MSHDQILFRKKRDETALQLSIGAPSSPFISNSIMYVFDEQVHGYCADNEITYARYIDDLAFSTNRPHTLNRLLEFVQKVGRARNREFRAMTHRASLGQLSATETNYLKGMIAYIYSIEPELINSLKRMVGENTTRLMFLGSQKN